MNKVVGILVGILLVGLALPVSASHVVTSEQEPNNLPAQANPVRMGCGVIGQAPLGDVDWFVLETPEFLATHRVRVQVYTPHPPLQCKTTISVRNESGPGLITYNGKDIDYKFDWSAKHARYWVSIESTCENFHYQLDFSRVRGPYRAYLPFIR